MLFRSITTGAGNDLEKVRELAQTYFMSGLSDGYGNTYITSDGMKYASDSAKDYLETNISVLISDLTDFATNLLTQELESLEIMAKRALEIETIDFNSIKHDKNEDDPIYSMIQEKESKYVIVEDGADNYTFESC